MSEYTISTRAADIDENVGFITITHHSEVDTVFDLKVTDADGKTVTVQLDWRGVVDTMTALGAVAQKL